MEFNRRIKTALLLLFIVIFSFAKIGFSQEKEGVKYPNRPITFIIPIPPGGSADLCFRLIIKEAEKFLGQPIIPVNKPGGSHTIGIAAIASSKPDGYTIGFTGNPGMFTAPHLQKVPYHPVKDLRQIMQFGYGNLGVTVKGDSPFHSLKDLVAYARENSNKLTYGTTGVASVGNLAMELIAKKEHVRFIHMPFRGSPEVLAALLGGHILAGAGDFNYSLLETQDIRLLALIAETRSTAYPETPILKDLGYDIPAPILYNVAGPKGIPNEIAHKLEDAFTRAMNEPAFIKGMNDLRVTILYRNSKELEEYVAYHYGLSEKILKEMAFIK